MFTRMFSQKDNNDDDSSSEGSFSESEVAGEMQTFNFNEEVDVASAADVTNPIMDYNVDAEENIVDVNEKAELALYVKNILDIKPSEQAGKALLDLIEKLPKINSLLGKVFKRNDVDNNYYTYNFDIIHDRANEYERTSC